MSLPVSQSHGHAWVGGYGELGETAPPPYGLPYPAKTRNPVGKKGLFGWDLQEGEAWAAASFRSLSHPARSAKL